MRLLPRLLQAFMPSGVPKGQLDILLKRDVIVASFAINILGLALPLVLLQVYDRLIPRQAVETLTLLALGLAGAIVLEILLRNARTVIMAWDGAQFEHRTTLSAMDHIIKADLKIIENDAPGVHLDRIHSIEKIRDYRSGEAVTAFLDIPFAFCFLALMAFIALPLAIVLVVILLVSFLSSSAFGHMIRPLLKERSRIEEQRNSFLIEVLKAIEPLKSLGLESFMERRYERLMGSAARIAGEQTALQQISTGFMGALAQLTTTAVAAVGAILVMQDNLTIGALAAGTLLAGRVVQPLFRLQSVFERDKDVSLHEEKLETLLQVPFLAGGNLNSNDIQDIELKSVTVYGKENKPPLFKDLNFKVRKGEVIGIRGANGSGKTSLMWLLMGVLKPDEGHLLINGVDSCKLSYETWRYQIAFLPQKPVLLYGTLIENLTQFDNKNNLEEAIEIACQLGLERFFAERPDGLSLKVGGGVETGFPSSVHDRIAMVRSLVGRPKLILFDEANLTLDSESDARVREYLCSKRKDAAVIMITQRPSYLAMADQRYILSDSSLVIDTTPLKTAHHTPSSSDNASVQNGAVA